MSKSMADRLAKARDGLKADGVTINSKEWLAEAGNVALWSDGRITVVLPRVTSACWCIAPDPDDGDQDLDIVSMERATSFEITSGDDSMSLTAAHGCDFKALGVSFLRALSLYWETRS